MKAPIPVLLTALLLPVAAAATDAQLFEKSTGQRPALPEPESSFLPTLHIAPAKGWPAGSSPKAAPGFEVQAFASKLDHPRWLHVLPNGDVLVAESDAPPQPEATKGIKGWIAKIVMKRAGSGLPSANRITLLRDTNSDGVADVQTVFLKDLNSPIGMALIGNQLYVANTDAVMRFPYQTGATSIAAAGTKLADLPGGPLNYHWTKNIIASKDGKRLYATVGSNSNIGEFGMDKEVNRAAILEIDVATGKTSVFASGLRNPNGMDWEPKTGALWTVANERDELGNDLVPDYLTSVKRDGFYGWPYSYFGQRVDTRVNPPRPDLVAKALAPDYALGGHVAALGLAFYQGNLFAQRYVGGAFIGQHGSWNRKPRSGYNVVFVPFSNGMPSGKIEEVLTGFVDAEGNALGRPVGVAVDLKGGLLVADDVGDTIWRVVPSR